MLELLLVRHGQTDWNKERKVMGRQPVPLNTEGRAQSRRLAKGLKDVPIHSVYVSPVKRTMQTAQILLKGRDSVPLLQEDGLAEIDYGKWVNADINELLKEPLFQQYLNKPSEFLIPDGENMTDVLKRSAAFIEKIKTTHNGQRIVALSHADLIRTIIVHCLGIPLDEWQILSIDNASISVFRFDDSGSARLVTLNCHCDWTRYFAL